MTPWIGILHEALGNDLSDFLQGREDADAALGGVAAAFETAAKTQGFLQ